MQLPLPSVRFLHMEFVFFSLGTPAGAALGGGVPGGLGDDIRVICPLRGTTISIRHFHGLWTSGQLQLGLQLLFSEPQHRDETRSHRLSTMKTYPPKR